MQLYSNHVARLALLVLLAQPKPVAMRDVALKGVIDPETRALAGTVVAVIGMPIGRVSITGQLRARIACDGTFIGTVSYSRIVRIFAALKRTDLVTQLDGSIVDTLQVTQAQSSPMLGSSVVQPAAVELSFVDPPVTATFASDAPCKQLSADTVQGKAVVERTELRGALALAADSVHFAGPAWSVGDSTYHSVVRVTRADRVIALRINLYERGHSRRP